MYYKVLIFVHHLKNYIWEKFSLLGSVLYYKVLREEARDLEILKVYWEYPPKNVAIKNAFMGLVDIYYD